MNHYDGGVYFVHDETLHILTFGFLLLWFIKPPIKQNTFSIGEKMIPL